ncbi:MAG TPA: glycosyltransferase family 87 protein [Gemmatimonadaceae bacterium]
MHQGVLQRLIRSTAHRLRARAAAIPLPRLRRILLALYLTVAFADAAAKALAANASVNRALSRFAGSSATVAQLESARKPGGNFEIFRAASRHLFAGEDLYAEWPAEHVDRFKYSPTFAVLFAPFSWLYWPLALFLWSALNALVLFFAIERLLPPRAALVASAFLLLEILRAMQNAQSNALVAGLIVLAFVALERRKAWRAAAAIVAGASVKIFPLAALSFAIPRRRVWRTGVAAVAAGVAALLVPLAVVSPAALAAQYRSWRAVESSDAQQRWFSVMELLHRWLGASWPNWPVQLGGTLLLLAPLALRRDRWEEHRFRLLYLCSVLIYVVLFNHQAERASYLIAFTGIAIWFAAEPRATWRTALFALAFVTITLMSTLIPGSPKSPTAMLYRLAGPSLLVWIAIQVELWKTVDLSSVNSKLHSNRSARCS